MRKKQDIELYNSDGQPHGLWVFYHPNGNLMSIQRYVDGKVHGIYELYRKDGKLWYKSCLINGEEVYTEWYSNINRIRFDI